MQQEALVDLLAEVEGASSRQLDLKSQSALAGLKATDKQLSKLCKLLKRVEKAAEDKRLEAEKERREQQKRKLSAEREAETKRLAATLEEAHVKAKQELAEAGQGGPAAGGAEEGFSVRKRSKTEAPP